MELTQRIAQVAKRTAFSGAIRVSRAGETLFELACGMADTAHGIPNTQDTQFGVASMTKGLTALATASLVNAGKLKFETPLRSLLPEELPLVSPTVTIEQLLSHTSGVGDYLDEEQSGTAADAYTLSLPVHLLCSPRDYLPLLNGLRHQHEPGTVAKYNNSGYVMLALAIEIASGESYYDLVRKSVLHKADMTETAFYRGDSLPGATAIGYLADGRVNSFHLPMRAGGDGGAYSTVLDIEKLWIALFEGRILPLDLVKRLTSPRNFMESEKRRYGMGFWVHAERHTVMLEGQDPGISARSVYDPGSKVSYTVVSNTSAGAWPIVAELERAWSSL